MKRSLAWLASLLAVLLPLTAAAQQGLEIDIVGGNAAARLAIEAPASVRGLVLVAPGGFTPHNFVTRMFCKLQGSRFSLPPRLFAGLYLKHRTPTVRGMLHRAATVQSEAARIALNRAMWRSFGVFGWL